MTPPMEPRQTLIPQLWERRRRYKRTPFGYFKDPEDNSYVLPDPTVMPVLEQALINLNNGESLREVSEWIEVQVRIPISHSGLRVIWYEIFPEKKAENLAKPKLPKLTPEERAKRKARRELGNKRRRLTHLRKAVAELEGNPRELHVSEEKIQSSQNLLGVREIDYSQLSQEVLESPEREAAFIPNPGPQTEFLASDELEVLYGGSAGGGKSYAIIADPMRYFDNPHFSGLIVRKTFPELKELIWKAQMLYARAFGNKIKWNEGKSQFKLPGGGYLWFSHLDREEEVEQYIGQAFNYIAFDELTRHATPFTWNFMRSRLRTTEGSGLPLYMRATTNPGGPGHGWVKKMFIDPAPAGEPFWAKDLDTEEIIKYPKDHRDPAKRGKPIFQRKFIPARVSDNPYLWNEGDYEANLLSLPEDQRRQLLEGDWNIADGAAFREFRPSIHTCRTFDIPQIWRRFRSCDFGYSQRQASAVHWYAVDPTYNTLYVYRELYVNQLTGRELARRILSLEVEEEIAYGVLDSSVWAVRGQSGPSIAEEMIAEGCRWRPADRSKGSRIDGKNRLHQLLRVDPKTEKPGIIFFDTCRQIITDLPVIPSDTDSDDIDPDYASDHAYDSVRYGVMTRPRPNPLDWVPIRQRVQQNYRPYDATFGY